MINLSSALSAFNTAGIETTADFHTLSTSQVEVILEQARLSGYRKPANANGSTARYFFAAVVRKRRQEYPR
jgi:hypothetical protein